MVRKNWEEAKLKGLAALDKAAADFRGAPSAKLPLPNSKKMVKPADPEGLGQAEGFPRRNAVAVDIGKTIGEKFRRSRPVASLGNRSPLDRGRARFYFAPFAVVALPASIPGSRW